MQAFLLQSIIASVVLTVLLNLLPRLFPKATDKAEQRIHEQVRETFESRDSGEGTGGVGGRRVKVFFPWKAMLAVSVVLTVLVNVAGYFSGA